MSRLDQRDLRDNPSKRFINWKTKKKEIKVGKDVVEKMTGVFEHYDKDSKTNIEIPLPFKFALINEDLVNFKGYNDKLKLGVYSNEVRSFSKEVETEMEVPTLGKRKVKIVDRPHDVTIRNKNGVVAEFNIADYKQEVVKGKIENASAKYGKSVYIGVPNSDGEIELQNLQLSGAALTGATDFKDKNPDEALDGWFNFTAAYKKTKALYTHWIVVKEFKVKKKGSTKFTIPVYEIGEVIDKAEGNILDDLTRELDDYLEYYFDKGQHPKEGEYAKRYYLVGSNKEVTKLVLGETEDEPAEVAPKVEVKKTAVKQAVLADQEEDSDDSGYEDVDEDDSDY